MTDRAPSIPTSLADLTWLNVSDIMRAFGLGPRAPLRGLAELAARLPAQRFARKLQHLDTLVGVEGLRAGTAWICRQLSDGIMVRGAPAPPSGPLLIVANHPGLLDAAALVTAIARTDLRVLAIKRPFLRALPHIAEHLFAVGVTPVERTSAVRAAARHLRAGGALLTFPAGRIEPDPVSLDGAAAALEDWSASVDLIARLAAPVPVLPVIVGNVLTPAALSHPLTRLRRDPDDQRWLAAIMQLMRPELRRSMVRVQFGRLIAGDHTPVSAAVRDEAARLIAAVAQP